MIDFDEYKSNLHSPNSDYSNCKFECFIEDVECRTYDEQNGIALIKTSLEQGINYFETGPWYGQGSSEKTFGKALADVNRESYFIGSKIGRYEKEIDEMFDFSSEKTEASVDVTLTRLGLKYVDIIQIHDFSFAYDQSIVLKETLPTLAKIVRDGKARYIGLADYDLDLMKEVVEESEIKISTILSYAKSTLIDNRLQNYTKYFQSKGVGVINAAATGMGLLCNRGPQSWHPANDYTKDVCCKAAEYCKAQKVELARLATWFTFDQPDIDTNVCGVCNVQQLNDTVDLLYKGLSDHEREVLAELQTRFLTEESLHWDGVELQEYRAKMNKKI